MPALQTATEGGSLLFRGLYILQSIPCVPFWVLLMTSVFQPVGYSKKYLHADLQGSRCTCAGIMHNGGCGA